MLSSPLDFLLELDITLVLHERGLPRHILLLLRQLPIELAMSGAVKRAPLQRAILVTLIGVKESSERIC